MKNIQDTITPGDLAFELSKTTAVVKIETIETVCNHFKIGKTGQIPEDRFDSNYANYYDSIMVVYSSNNPDDVSQMEADLIDYYEGHPKCDNIKDGDESINDQMTSKNGQYITYVVYS